MSQLTGKKIAFLSETGFEEVELTEPKKALEQAGAQVEIVSPAKDTIQSWDQDHWGFKVKVDKHVSTVKSSDYDALVLPGGVINPDKLRRSEEAVNFIQSFFEEGKTVAAICHAPQSLIEADVVRGRKMTSFHSIQTDLKNAGAQWVNEEVVFDQQLITSRNPDDLPAFCKKIMEVLA